MYFFNLTTNATFSLQMLILQPLTQHRQSINMKRVDKRLTYKWLNSLTTKTQKIRTYNEV